MPDGAPVPTGTPGPQTFSVTATDRAGNMVTVRRGYTVSGPATVPLTPAPLVPAPPVTPVVADPVAAGEPAVLPPPENARRLRPRLGAKLVSTRPVLRWKALEDARFYNVQVFRLTGKRLVKVLSVFPRTNHVRVPPGRLTPRRHPRVARLADGEGGLHPEAPRHQQLRGAVEGDPPLPAAVTTHLRDT